jgi:hypothetical protein
MIALGIVGSQIESHETKISVSFSRLWVSLPVRSFGKIDGHHSSEPMELGFDQSLFYQGDFWPKFHSDSFLGDE